MVQPKSVDLLPDGLHIEWDDGRQCRYPHRVLRGRCPCASCVNEMTGKRMVSTKDVAEGVEALDWMTVGRYAIQVLWSDAHQTGIYPYEMLHRLCDVDDATAPDGT